jgi:hypothetical protein
MTEAVEKAFEDAKSHDLEAVMILGLNKNGGVSINSSMNNVAIMNWMLNESLIDLYMFRRQNQQKPEEQVEAEVVEEDK